MKLLGRRGLAPTLLLLPLATAKTSPRNSSTPAATTPTAATTSTPNAATIAATKAPTPATTPTTATTSTTSTASTAAPTTTPAATSTTLATLALAAATLPTSRSSPDILSTKDVNSSSRGVGGGKGGGGAPLKEGRARSATSGTYTDYTSLSCKEVLLEQVNSEVGGVKFKKVVPECAKRVREAGEYEVEGDVSASGPVAAPCSCRLLSHQTLLWHHRLGHPSLPRLCGMHSRLLFSGLPRSLPPLPPSPASPCLPCVEG
ncbi:unnamed protein product [Closterium sp. NIES-53]